MLLPAERKWIIGLPKEIEDICFKSLSREIFVHTYISQSRYPFVLVSAFEHVIIKGEEFLQSLQRL